MALGKQVLELSAKLDAAEVVSEWARIPRIGHTLEGMFRSQIFALVASGKVKSAAIKQPGQIRAGMRLVHIPSLRAYIANFAEGGAE